MRPLLTLGCGALLLWQLGGAVVSLAARVRADAAVPYRLRLLASTNTRIAATLGDDYEIYQALRREVPTGKLTLVQRVQDPRVELTALVARDARITSLSHLLYPAPILLGMPDPIGILEGNAAAVPEGFLLLFAGDRAPEGRAGWQRIAASERFELWRFQKAS